MRKWILSTVVIVTMMLTACPAQMVTPSETEPSAATTGGKIFYNSYMSDPVPRQADEAMVAAFEQATGIAVEHSVISHEDFKQAIRTYLASDAPPDVLTWFAGNRARFFIDNGLIMDISDVWQAEGWDQSYPKGFLALSTVNEKQYFVPTNYYWWAIYYRPSLYEKAGITPPTTWDELLNACDALNNVGVTPFAIGTKFPWTAAGWFDYLNMRVNGPEFHINLMLGKESYTDARVKDVFTHWAQLFEHNCFIKDAAAYGWQEGLDFMIQGEAASYLMGQFITDSYPDELETDLDFYRFPIINPDVPIGEDAPTDGFFIAAKAPNPELAKQFIAYLGGVEAQTAFAKTTGRIVTHTGVDISFYSPEVQKGIKLIQDADYVAQFYDRDTTPEMAEKGMAMFMAFWNDPTGDVDKLLTELDQERVRIFSED